MLHSLIISLIFLITGNSADKKIDNYLKEKLSGYDKYEFEIVRIPGEDFEFILEDNVKLTSGLNYLPVKVKKKNSGYKQTYIIIRLKLYKKVFVLQDDIPQRQVINPEKLDIKSVELTNLKGTPIGFAKDLNGFRTKTLLKAGTVLFKESLEYDPVIKNGDWISASSISGKVVVEFNAEAKQEGIIGEIIRIVSKDKKQFKAKIIDSNNVIIVE